MRLMKKILKKEDGSATIEFLGMIPFVLILVAIIWQFGVTIHAVVVAKSAANEAAKVYSLTQDTNEASDAAKKIVDMNGNNISFQDTSIPPGKKFKATVNVKINYIFLPKKLFGGRTPSYSFSSSASGRTID
ncbi:pilus assembly protein [Heyndrickxia oleronia]|uniref:TadE/TadG family type IV pilus assembly protein n=1 Tax=Heyndrickxia oleronia TaxID=38875 RepID=UPI0007174530|nr:TadE family protein [Heyndrickxia oleronia]MBU5214815.1 pilus assembly protein [Heyndrickxia oleronia]MCM3457175.1 pilus assembly protein [Heyndrickxia oleronia]NYV68440.1 pilus assembly protein [Bacillus sp. Gen3]